MRRGKLLTLVANDTSYAVARMTTTEVVIAVFNNAKQEQTIGLDTGGIQVLTNGPFKDELGAARMVRLTGHALSVTLPPRSAAIINLK